MSRSNAFTLGLVLLVMLLSLIAQGCSSHGIIDAAIESDEALKTSSASDGRQLWGIYAWDYDKASGTIDAVPLRELELHYDVTDYLEPPKCTVCLAIEILNISSQMHDMWVLVTIMNPTPLTAKDVRGIILDENKLIKLMDPYAATQLWDWHYPKWYNDFLPFMKADKEREFGPGEQDSVMYRLRFPDNPDFSGMRYIIDASWPGHCKEPYEFYRIAKSAPLGTETTDQINIVAEMLDWQVNYGNVKVDLTPLGYPSWIWLDYNAPQFWYVLKNTYSAPEGKYPLQFVAYDQEVSDTLSKYLDVYVDDDNIPPNWSGPLIGIQKAEAGNKSAKLTYGFANDLVSPPVIYTVFIDNKVPYDFVDAFTISDIGPSPKTIYGLKNGATHVFMVRAMDAGGNMELNEVKLSCIPHE